MMRSLAASAAVQPHICEVGGGSCLIFVSDVSASAVQLGLQALRHLDEGVVLLAAPRVQMISV